MNLLPLFFVSLASVGYETALTRYFAVAKWSEYGYWVISIVMVGFALSGVMLALWRDVFTRRAPVLLAILPAILVVSAAVGYRFTTTNPFNPLQLQNPATWQAQIWNIAGYYAALLPFFFFAGLFISLTFVRHANRLGRVYAFDLTGAGAGALAVLAAMYLVHAFALVPLLLLPLAFSAVLLQGRHRRHAILAALASLVVSEALLLLDDHAAYNDFKAIYAPLHTQDARVAATVDSPRGDYALLDDFTERVDTDISNNAAMMGLEGPPRSLGLYRDGNRIAALPGPVGLRTDYAPAALDALPYELIPHAAVLLAGASGGFRPAEVLRLGASQVHVIETEPELRSILREGIGPVPAARPSPTLSIGSTLSLGPSGKVRYDVIDLSADFLDANDVNAVAFSREAIAADLRVLHPQGILSLPVSIRDFPVYALRVLATLRAALLSAGIADPVNHVLMYRSAWNVRILVSPSAFSPAAIALAKRFCDDRSFDLSWYPGIDVARARDNLYNDLPAVSFTKGEVEATGSDDAIADEAEAVLSGRPTASAQDFNLAPITLDQPFFYAVLRLDRLGTVLRRLEILPQNEVGALVNLAVLAQAVVLAALVLLVPLAAPGRLRSGRTSLLRAIVFFPSLALGFLFIELFLIEKASLWLGDRTDGFAFVLSGMLVFSGLGSLLSERFGSTQARTGMALSAVVILVWCAAMLSGLQGLILSTLAWPFALRALALLVVLAPVSIALGLPFPLGLSRVGEGGLLPWAWGLNGAFSVVATPLANLLSRETGLSRLLLCAALLYGIALATFPALRKRPAWQDIAAPSPAAE